MSSKCVAAFCCVWHLRIHHSPLNDSRDFLGAWQVHTYGNLRWIADLVNDVGLDQGPASAYDPDHEVSAPLHNAPAVGRLDCESIVSALAVLAVSRGSADASHIGDLQPDGAQPLVLEPVIPCSSNCRASAEHRRPRKTQGARASVEAAELRPVVAREHNLEPPAGDAHIVLCQQVSCGDALCTCESRCYHKQKGNGNCRTHAETGCDRVHFPTIWVLAWVWWGRWTYGGNWMKSVLKEEYGNCSVSLWWCDKDRGKIKAVEMATSTYISTTSQPRIWTTSVVWVYKYFNTSTPKCFLLLDSTVAVIVRDNPSSHSITGIKWKWWSDITCNACARKIFGTYYHCWLVFGMTTFYICVTLFWSRAGLLRQLWCGSHSWLLEEELVKLEGLM